MRLTGLVGALPLLILAACAERKDFGTRGAAPADASAPWSALRDADVNATGPGPVATPPPAGGAPALTPDAVAHPVVNGADLSKPVNADDASTVPGTALGAGGSTATGLAEPVAPPPLEFVTEPSFEGNDNPAVPQAGVLRLELNQPAALEVVVSGGGESWLLERGPASNFAVPIIGLLPETEYEVEVRALGEENCVSAGPLGWTTPPLPDNFPPIAVGSSVPEEMEPGMTFFNVRTGWSVYHALLVIVDAGGRVRWYHFDDDLPALEDPRLTSDGHFLFNDSRCTMREVDALGTVTGTWHATGYPLDCDAPSDSVPVAINSFHHDLGTLPDGSFLVLSNQVREVDGYPTSEDDPGAERRTAKILECVIVEFTRAGEITKYIPTGDLIDPTRVGRDSLSTSWTAAYVPEGERVYDWDHCNSVHYEAASDSYYVSLRHQDAVLKIARAEETLTWILGNPENWAPPFRDKLLTPVGELSWPFHQHSARPNRFGLGMYDNGNYRAAAFQRPSGEEYSRAVVYAIDEVERTIRQVWDHGPPTGEGSFYSSAMGDADWLPSTDNVLIVSAQMTNGSSAWAQIFEVKQDGTRVFELNVGEPDGETDGGYAEVQTVYRAERIPDIRE